MRVNKDGIKQKDYAKIGQVYSPVLYDFWLSVCWTSFLVYSLAWTISVYLMICEHIKGFVLKTLKGPKVSTYFIKFDQIHPSVLPVPAVYSSSYKRKKPKEKVYVGELGDEGRDMTWVAYYYWEPSPEELTKTPLQLKNSLALGWMWCKVGGKFKKTHKTQIKCHPWMEVCLGGMYPFSVYTGRKKEIIRHASQE